MVETRRGRQPKVSPGELGVMETDLRSNHAGELDRLVELMNSLHGQTQRERRGTYGQIATLVNDINGGDLSPRKVRSVMKALGLPTPTQRR